MKPASLLIFSSQDIKFEDLGISIKMQHENLSVFDIPNELRQYKLKIDNKLDFTNLEIDFLVKDE